MTVWGQMTERPQHIAKGRPFLMPPTSTTLGKALTEFSQKPPNWSPRLPPHFPVRPFSLSNQSDSVKT